MKNYKYKFWKIPEDISFLDFRQTEPDLVDPHGHSITSEYFQGYQSIYVYVYMVLSGERPAGRSEVAACERFVYDLHREDLVFDHDEADFCTTVIGCLRHPKGPIAGRQFYLMRWMQFILCQIYGWYYTDKARETLRGEMRFQKSFTAVGRGNSKTVLAAGAAIIMALITENGAPVITTSATVQKQSRLTFEDIGRMIKTASPSIKKRFQVLQNEIRVNHNGGRVMATSSESETLDGIRISFSVCDEIHAHKDSKIVDVLSTGMQSSKNPHLMMITTAGVNLESYGMEMFDYADEIAQNISENDRFLSVVYKVDKENQENIQDETIWCHANPALGHAVNLESLRSAYVEAQRNAKARANFLTKHCNVWVQFDEDNFIDGGELLECKDTAINIEDYKHRTCYLGLDLAGVSDLSSLVYIFPESNGGVTVFQKSYLPEAAIRNAKPSIKDRYFQAQKDGELIITPTEVTDFEYIKLDIVNAYKDFDVQALSIDGAAGGIRFALELEEEHHIEAVGVKQGFGLSESSNLLLNLIKNKKFKYNSKLLEWCFVNSLKVEGTYGDIKVVRSKSDHTQKIDICVATLIGLSQTLLENDKYSVYETADVRFI